MEELAFYITNRLHLPHWVLDAIVVALGVSYLASEFCARTHTPDPNTIYGKVYKVIEYIARIRGYAKEEGITVTQTDVETAVKDLEGK